MCTNSYRTFGLLTGMQGFGNVRRRISSNDRTPRLCDCVRVISSQAQVEPEFFLRTFTRTVQRWRKLNCDYVEAHICVRFAKLEALGA